MTEEDLRRLKSHDGRLVRLHLKDGEDITAKVLFVSETERDVIVDLVSSTRVATYSKDDVQPAFQYRFDDIASVEPFASE
jgi:hypothetical protein